jgi:hypothetical protein
MLFATGARGYSAGPDWLASLLSEPPPQVQPGQVAVQLLNERQVRYLGPDRVQILSRGAIKRLQAAATPALQVGVLYNAGADRIVSAEAWSVSPDGRKVHRIGQGEFLDMVAQYDAYSWDQQRTLTLNGSNEVGAGGVIAWEIQVESPSGVFGSTWSLANGIATVHSRFEVIPPPGGALAWHATSRQIGPPSPGPEPGELCWTLDGFRPYPAGRPSGFIPNPFIVSVQCSVGPGSPSQASWADQAKLAAGALLPKIDSGGEVRRQALALVAGKAERWARVRALAEFVQRNIVYLQVTLDADQMAWIRPHPPAEVLRNRYGDCKDKATLLVSLLRAIGEDGRMVLLTAGDPAAVTADWPFLGTFNHAIVGIPAGTGLPAGWPAAEAGPLGRLVLFDPTDPSTPLGVLSPGDQGGLGLIVDASRGVTVRLPMADPASSGIERKIVARLDPDGSLRATVDEQLSGTAASEVYAARYALGADRFQRILEAWVHASSPLAGNFQWRCDWDPLAARYRIGFGFQSLRWIREIGGGLYMVNLRILPQSGALAPWTTRAEGQVWLPESNVREEIRFPLPDGLSVEEMPSGFGGATESATGEITYGTEGRAIVVRCRVSRRGGFYTRAEYQAERTFEGKLIAAERQPVILHSSVQASR